MCDAGGKRVAMFLRADDLPPGYFHMDEIRVVQGRGSLDQVVVGDRLTLDLDLQGMVRNEWTEMQSVTSVYLCKVVRATKRALLLRHVGALGKVFCSWFPRAVIKDGFRYEQWDEERFELPDDLLQKKGWLSPR